MEVVSVVLFTANRYSRYSVPKVSNRRLLFLYKQNTLSFICKMNRSIVNCWRILVVTSNCHAYHCFYHKRSRWPAVLLGCVLVMFLFTQARILKCTVVSSCCLSMVRGARRWSQEAQSDRAIALRQLKSCQLRHICSVGLQKIPFENTLYHRTAFIVCFRYWNVWQFWSWKCCVICLEKSRNCVSVFWRCWLGSTNLRRAFSP